MTYEDLVDFIANKMRMSHIYQPLLIRTLVDSGGTATLRHLAHQFLAHDESQIRYYEDRIRSMPVKVLSRHGIVKKEGDLIALNIGKLTIEQQAQIKVLCEQKMQSFIHSRGLGLWDYRLGETDPVPDSLRYRVLAAAGGRCALCGITKDERPLDVDHIIPRSRGGTNDLPNLQALCTKCNRSKRNKDDTDFRDAPIEEVPDCPFCTAVEDRIVQRNGSVIAINDGYPVTPGHKLILPIRHCTDFFSMTEQERTHANELIRNLQQIIRDMDPSISGFNIGMNCGEAAGQTVSHAHIHFIPRRSGDVADPRGGVRGVIPANQNYEI